MSKKVVYLSGPITGKERYWEAFEKAEEELQTRGLIVLNPATLPEGLTKERYMAIDLAMLNAADVVFFLPDWLGSAGSNVEYAYADYIGKPKVAGLDNLDYLLKEGLI